MSCRLVGIPDLEDITDTDACREYQNHLESEPGYAGRDERRDKFERVQEQLSLVRRGKAQPEEFFLSEAQYLQRLELIVDRYNNERQEGKYCPGLSPREAFEKFHGNDRASD